jgi:hypothetical protein
VQKMTLVLAKSIPEANAYARLIDLPRSRYRAVRSAGAIKGIRNAEVHILPSFSTRPDRHSILGALRWARSLEVYYVDPADLGGVSSRPDPEPDLKPAGATDAELEEAYALNAVPPYAVAAPPEKPKPTPGIAPRTKKSPKPTDNFFS